MRSIFICLTISLWLSPLGVVAQEAPPPFPEFNARRVAAPAPGHVGPRINIQIAPQTGPSQVMRPQSESAAVAVAQPFTWFWGSLGHGTEGGAQRFQNALRLLETAPEAGDLNIARVTDLRAMAAEHGIGILRETIGTQVSPALVLAIIAVESAGDPRAISDAGAQGIMQLIPATADRFGVTDSLDAAQNIAGGVAYLDWLMDRFERDPILVLAAYNAGEGAVRDAGGVPDFAETRRYVPQVLATWRLVRLLCLSPPELISDGCVFQTMVEG